MASCSDRAFNGTPATSPALARTSVSGTRLLPVTETESGVAHRPVVLSWAKARAPDPNVSRPSATHRVCRMGDNIHGPHLYRSNKTRRRDE